MSRPLAIGLAQITGRPYAPVENRELSVQAAQTAFEDGADLVVLPELIVQGYVADRERLRDVAEPLDGPSVDAWRAVAAQAGGFVIGGFCERERDVLYNTAVVVGPDGVLLHYRKLHPFREETFCFEPGNKGLPVAQLPFGRVGLCVCYDLRFVETVRILALRDAELICVPTAWVAGFDSERWDERGLCPQAHGALVQANLSQVFTACASQVGQGEEYEFLGSSIVADPYGKLALGPMSGTEPGIEVAHVDLSAADEAQIRDPLIRPRADRRTDVYSVDLLEECADRRGPGRARPLPRPGATHEERS